MRIVEKGHKIDMCGVQFTVPGHCLDCRQGEIVEHGMGRKAVAGHVGGQFLIDKAQPGNLLKPLVLMYKGPFLVPVLEFQEPSFHSLTYQVLNNY